MSHATHNNSIYHKRALREPWLLSGALCTHTASAANRSSAPCVQMYLCTWVSTPEGSTYSHLEDASACVDSPRPCCPIGPAHRSSFSSFTLTHLGHIVRHSLYSPCGCHRLCATCLYCVARASGLLYPHTISKPILHLICDDRRFCRCVRSKQSSLLLTKLERS